MQETATLVNATDPELVEEIKAGASAPEGTGLRKRIVLFAPSMWGIYASTIASTAVFGQPTRSRSGPPLTHSELIREVEMLEEMGQKTADPCLRRTSQIHPGIYRGYGADCIPGEKRQRRNPPGQYQCSSSGHSGIQDGTGCRHWNLPGLSGDLSPGGLRHVSYRRSKEGLRLEDLTALDRAQEAGIDDVGIGALFGLYDWRFEVLGLIRHVNHLEAVYKVGPHTICFPRLQRASGMHVRSKWEVSDEDFTRMVAILRLAVPYTGLILTAREPAEIRDEVLEFGVSQIDGGTRIEMKAYAEQEGDSRTWIRNNLRSTTIVPWRRSWTN